MHYLTRLVEFEASHRYWQRLYSTAENQRTFGKCISPYGHGHNYVLSVTVGGSIDPKTGMVINITELDLVLRQVSGEFDHKFINLEHLAFQDSIPTTENLAVYMYDRVSSLLRTRSPRVHVSRLRLYEEPSLWADVLASDEQGCASLTKAFRFSAARQLQSNALSAEENRSVYGPAAGLHGHDYLLDVTVHGRIDPLSGMIVDLVELMELVQVKVIAQFDHKHLNLDTGCFVDRPPTGENLTNTIWDLLRPALGPRLARVGVRESSASYFETTSGLMR